MLLQAFGIEIVKSRAVIMKWKSKGLYFDGYNCKSEQRQNGEKGNDNCSSQKTQSKLKLKPQ